MVIMPRCLTTFVLALTVSTLPTACSSAPPLLPVPDGAAALSSWTATEAIQKARSLMLSAGASEQNIATVAQRLAEMVEDPGFVSAMESMGGIRGVAILAGGGGGALISSSGGQGLVSFAGGDEEVPLYTEVASWGATVGGGTFFGAGFAMGLEHQQQLQNRYDLVMQGGTAGPVSFGIVRGTAQQGGHKVWFTSTGEGFGANAAYGRANLTFEKP